MSLDEKDFRRLVERLAEPVARRVMAENRDSYPMYKARNLLAAIDYQKHKDRTQVTDGKPVIRQMGVTPVKEVKEYDYLPDLMKGVYQKRLEDPSTQRTPSVVGEDDPRRLASTIRPTQPPPTAELVKRHQSRF
ncbi:hypothetical protein HOLleu_36413 [Holothuria leucospilota]|uniref:Uncharacterized protein n=1 Tax=Holothuria leucospilota TaxID=206669 RepID=A0A9Q1BGK9_HOLLE|nr:hypothetical protein HOLleu_36413 [Holothuria leucospilota]